MRIFGLQKVEFESIDHMGLISCVILDAEELETRLETKDLLETVTGSPSEQKAVKEEENKMKEKEEKLETQGLMMQQVGSIHSSK